MKFFFLITVFILSGCGYGENLSEAEMVNYKNQYHSAIATGKDQHAYMILKKLSEKGDLFSTNELGGFYELGVYVEEDLEQALKLYAEAGNKNYIPAKYNVGRIRFQQGRYEEAASILNDAADNNDAPAINLLGVMYQNGFFYEKNLKKSLELYAKSAKMGNPDAQFNLGQLLFSGDQVKQDYEKAYYWYRLSADQGYTLAKIQLAILYSSGQGVAQDVSKAIEILKPIAESGDTDAIYNIRNYYKKMGDLESYKLWDKRCNETAGCLNDSAMGADWMLPFST
ncbi:TPR repeat protein [Acinetobacter calcoaceticus]|uniref:TPR repeat protein n=1 Tax=Acinetobacter calcoaceticus TaxID=471 RepID=A0A4R1XA70_ACICA|nr:TPR repeat protein [Acinetobacter calcoaceticus]